MAIYFGITVANKLVQADAYYAVANHIRHFDWDGYSEDEQKAALLQAERELDAHIGMTLEDSYSNTSFPIAEWSSYRPDYAVFEQALYLLNNTARQRTASSGAELIESDQYQEDERTIGVGIAPEAMVFLRINRVQIERG